MRRLLPFLLPIPFLLAVILLAGPLYRQLGVNRVSLAWRALSTHGQAQPEVAPSLEGHPRAPYWRAITAQQAGDPGAVITILEPRLQDGDAFAGQISARAYEDLGDLQAAAALWAQLGIGPNLQRVADTALAAGDLEAARAALAGLFELSANEGTVSLARFLDQDLADPAAAEQVYQGGIDRIFISRNLPYILVDYARFLEAQGRWADAAAVHRQVIDSLNLFYLEERNPDRRFADLANAQLMAGQPRAAVASIEEAMDQMKIESTRPLYIYNLAGQIYEAVNQLGAARQAYRHALRLDPQNSTALEALQRLRTR